MKFFILVSVFTSLLSCKSAQIQPSIKAEAKNAVVPLDNTLNLLKLEASDPTAYANTITTEALKEAVYIFAGDEMEGRSTGTRGQKKAAEFLRTSYKELGIPSPEGIDYFQNIPKSYFNGKGQDSENVLAFIEGSTYPDEIVVLSAHYDHIGMDSDGTVFNGADDDASGTMGVLKIAEAFAKAKKEGNGPKRSVLFLHVTGEEIGLYGSKFYTENPIYPLANTVADLNIDMIGRIDKAHENDTNYIYLIGSDRLSKELHQVSELVNKKYSQFNLDYTFNDENDPNRFYFRSDHYNFAKNNVPIIFYFNGVHDDYHKATDTPDKIEYELMTKRCKLVFYTAWELANRTERIRLTKVTK